MMKQLQRLGRTFMLPIALLPVAGLMLGIGASFTGESFVTLYGLEWLLGEGTMLFAVLSVFKDAGDVIFANLPLLFAVGVALGLAKENKEVSALSAVVAYLMMYASMTSAITHFGNLDQLIQTPGLISNVLGFENTMNMGVFGGIIVGVVVSMLHNKFYTIKLPDALSFFSGTRFVPIVSAFAAVIMGLVFTGVWPYAGMGIAKLGELVGKMGYLGTFIYGYVYRALIPLGLHHVFYLPFWQTALGGVSEVAGVMVEGAQNIVFAQLSAGVPVDPEAARFFTGMFPFMIFGFPAAALAMYHTARPERKEDVKGLLVSSSLTSVFTGITEPIEFAFLFASPFLYFGVHGILAASSFALMHLLKAGVGVTFSGGLLDLVLYGILPGQANTNWIPVILVGVVYAFLYYGSFRFIIQKFNLKTPGREDVEEKSTPQVEAVDGETEFDHRAAQIMAGLGGKENVKSLDYCATRLRIEINDDALVDEAQIKAAKIAGLMRPGAGSIQIVIGPDVQFVARAFQKKMK